jgi:hypothetical protein
VEAPPEGAEVSRVAAIVGALLLLAGTARAGSAKWTLPATAGWTDITADALEEPQILALKKSITDNGGRFEGTSFADAGGTVAVVITIDVPSMPATMGDLNAFETAARSAGKTAGPELSYTKQVAPTHWSATQRIGGAEPIATRRFAGFLQSGGLRAVSINCYGDAAVCDPLLASATFSTEELRALSSLALSSPDEKPLSYRIGYFLGSASLLALLVYWLWKQRRRPAA